VQELFSLCLVEPWDEQLIAVTVETNIDGWITLAGFLAFWTYVVFMSWLTLTICWHSLQTNLDYTVTAQFLAWVGYPVLQKDTLSSALQGMVFMYCWYMVGAVWVDDVLTLLVLFFRNSLN
jgi:hypothetical protein